MFGRKYSHRKPDPLILLFILVSLAVLMTSAVGADEPFYDTLSLADLEDGEIMLAPLGRHGASMHMSYQTNPYLVQTTKQNFSNGPRLAPTPTFFLSLRVPW